MVSPSSLFLREGSDLLYLFDYHTKKSGLADADSAFIWDLKNGNAKALERLGDLLVERLVAADQRLFLGHHAQWSLIVVPSSRVGGPKVFFERMLSKVAERVSWVTCVPRALRRTQAVPSSHLAGLGERPTSAIHQATIAYEGPRWDTAQGIILFDDIYTTGATMQACHAIIEQNIPCGKVYKLVIGRTV